MEQNKDFEAYLKKYADTYCNGDTEEARKHAIVKEVEKSYKGCEDK